MVIFAILLLCTTLVAQGTWQLGSYQWFSGIPSGPLQVNLADAGGLGSHGFVSRVGGVAFAQTAVPESTVVPGRIRLRYLKDALDGRRLQVQFGEAVILTPQLPDWLLVPVARFSNSTFDSCVSLFGPQTTATSYDIVYHLAFQNTLLGVRLLQADMLLFNLNETWRLPTLGGSTPLGHGETIPAALNVESAMRIQSALRGRTFQSWVLTDEGEDIRFGTSDGTLRMTGRPYYYFWTSDIRAVQARQAQLRAQAAQARAAGNIREHNRIVSKHNSLTPVVSPVSELTERMKELHGDLRRFNPAVYDAAMTTMHYAAFFRYVRQAEPNEWRIFLKELEADTALPRIATPTRWAR